MFRKIINYFNKIKYKGVYYIEGDGYDGPMSWHGIVSTDTSKTYNFSSEYMAIKFMEIRFPDYKRVYSTHQLLHPNIKKGLYSSYATLFFYSLV